jgi:hypothetical protein
MRTLSTAVVLFASSLFAQTNAAPSAATDPLQPVAFLEGRWVAKTQGGSASAQGAGTYTFQRELKGHVLARRTETYSGCKGPAAFDCEHSDLLFIYADSDPRALKAIYFDNEGHVITYDVSVPDPATAILLSDEHKPGPQFRLMYQLKNAVLSGKFQMRMPGQKDWQSYLEWSGPKQ